MDAGRKELYSRHSSHVEKMLEHVFVSEVLQEAWLGRGLIVEVSRGEVDAYGYDIVMECGGTVRHIQLKTRLAEGKTNRVEVSVLLGEKPGGCVVWMLHNELANHRFGLSYLFFGGRPGERMTDIRAFKVAKHTKHNSKAMRTQRPNIREVGKSRFEKLATISEVVARLFGPAKPPI
jgi:hypothetical protein